MSSFRKPLTVLRTSNGYYDTDGFWHDGSVEEITIRASVQPMTAGEAAHYTRPQSEGAFTSLMVALYSDEPFLPEKQANGVRAAQEADVILWLGRRMKVIQCEPWQNDVINHYRSIAQEIEEREEDDDTGNEEISP